MQQFKVTIARDRTEYADVLVMATDEAEAEAFIRRTLKGATVGDEQAPAYWELVNNATWATMAMTQRERIVGVTEAWDAEPGPRAERS